MDFQEIEAQRCDRDARTAVALGSLLRGNLVLHVGAEAQRNVELMGLTGRLAPDFKTIADFHRANGAGIRLLTSV